MNHIDELPIDQVYTHPVVQELLDKIDKLENRDLEKEVKVPYVIKNKILMSPGIWNNYEYSGESIKEAYLRTQWDSKEIRSLFLDHEDAKSKEWVGEVRNVRLKEDNIIGDLYVLDKPTAIKLAWGAKFGISPKVKGMEEDDKMLDFTFSNFSVVINPAVKTAYINNMEVKKMEDIKIEETSKEVSVESSETEELKKKKEKYPYPKEESENKEKYPVEPFKGPQGVPAKYELNEDLEKELSEWTDKIKDWLKKNPGKTVKDAIKAIKKMFDEEELMMSDIKEMVEKVVIEALKNKKYPYPKDEKCAKKKEKYPYPKKMQEEEEVEEEAEESTETSDVEEDLKEKKIKKDTEKTMSSTVKELQDTIQKLEKKLNEPDRKSVKTEELTESGDPDIGLLDVFKNMV